MSTRASRQVAKAGRGTRATPRAKSAKTTKPAKPALGHELSNVEKNAVMRMAWTRSVPAAVQKQLANAGYMDRVTGWLTPKGEQFFRENSENAWNSNAGIFKDINKFT